MPGAPALDATLQPMLPERAPEPFDDPAWIFEFKWGGVRALAVLRDGRVSLRGEGGAELTLLYPELRSMPSQFDGGPAVIDGEIIALDRAGYPDPRLTGSRLYGLPVRTHVPGSRPSAVYLAWDLLEADGDQLLGRPLWERKNLLHARFSASPVAQPAFFVEQDGMACFQAACEHGLEGIIAKHRLGMYRPGERSKAWLDISAPEVAYFVVGGYTFGGGGRRAPFESLLLGGYHDGVLEFVGRARASLSGPEGWRIVRMLEPLHSIACPFSKPPLVDRFVYWCRPLLVCQVRLGERRPDGTPRFMVFAALRPDRAPLDCVRE